MFQKPAGVSKEGSETLIGPSVKLEGDLKGVGNVMIEGELQGTLSTDKNVTVGDQAIIKASISANNLTIAGNVQGSLSISGHLDVKSTATISGDISTGTISIESGAKINGQLKMGEQSAASPSALHESVEAEEEEPAE